MGRCAAQCTESVLVYNVLIQQIDVDHTCGVNHNGGCDGTLVLHWNNGWVILCAALIFSDISLLLEALIMRSQGIYLALIILH